MTGPRLFTVRPRHRRGRHLLPFLLAVALSPLGCSSDQATEPVSTTGPGQLVASTGSHPRPKLAGARMNSATATRSATPKALVSFAVANAVSSTGPTVLILADTDVVSTTALATSLTSSGVQVTVRPAPEYTWDGTNPSLSGFDVVIHLDGATYDFPLPSSAQDALTNFVQNGGGFVGARWNGYESQPELANLALQIMGNDPMGPEMNCGACQVTYETLPAGEGHPVLAGLPASFTFTADANDAGPQVSFASQPSTVLMMVSSGGPSVLVRDFGSGRVVNFSFAPNYPFDDLGGSHEPATLQDPNIQRLYLNAVEWAAGSASGTAQPQSITFDPLADKTYGDAAFSISAAASSNLPVSFTATGGCGVLGTSVTITSAGTCTITAHQAGNDDYTAAEDVSQSFEINPASPTIQWSPAPLSAGTPLGLAQLNATATGLGGTALSGTWTYNPAQGTVLAAGTYTLSVQFNPSNPNYAPASSSVSITTVGVAMTFTGFYAPVKNSPFINIVNAGSTIPMKFALLGYRGSQVLKAGSPASMPVQCSATAADIALGPTVASLGALQSLGTGYLYMWRTNVSWAGTCRKFVLTLADGSTHSALFRFAPPPRGKAVRRR
jgi:trehalose utilization protein